MISVLCPTRGRSEILRTSVNSLIKTASNPVNAEILLAIDPDDEATWNEAATLLFTVHRWKAPERYGYVRLNEYWNALAGQATGDWLLLWNDDAQMLTPGWDTIVEAERPAVLWAYTRGDDAGNYFPLWPAAWTRLLGRICPIPGPHVDTYIQEVGKHLGRIRRIPVELAHDRPDFTGVIPADRTYQEGRLPLGRYGMVPGWHGPDLPELAAADAAAIKAAGLL